jgi:ribosome biogenesis GTPase / thiamine phosphate phosphatase
LSLAPSLLLHGEIAAVHGRHYIVQLASGELITCFPRGKRSLAACGDRVAVMRTAAGQAVIEAVDPRRTLLYRSDQHRQKLIAANVTQMVIVLATVPSFYEELLNRCLVAAVREGITALIVMNKLDLASSHEGLDALELYRGLGYRVLPLSAKTDVSPLRSSLSGHLSVLVGQSGMGKSTIVNGIFPQAEARVGDVSFALDSGRHTTTHSRLYRLDQHSGLIDSPGMQEFGLAHLTIPEVAAAYPEFRPYLGQCRFTDCRHCDEPDCAIALAAARVEISPRRLELYRRIARDLARAGKATRGSGKRS